MSPHPVPAVAIEYVCVVAVVDLVIIEDTTFVVVNEAVTEISAVVVVYILRYQLYCRAQTNAGD